MLTLLATAESPVVCPAALERGVIEGNDGQLFAKWELETNLALDPMAEEGLAHLAAAYARHDMALVVLVLPTRALASEGSLGPDVFAREEALSSYRGLVSSLANIDGLSVIDGLMVAEDHGPGFYFGLDHHWTPDGARLAADAVAATVMLQDSWTGLPDERWITKKGTAVETPGNVGARVSELCDSKPWPPIRYDSYTTHKKGKAPRLLDESPPAPIVTVGTSMLDPQWHFEGFLEAAVGSDVHSVGVGGGHALGAMLAWLRTADLDTARPRVVVWELEAIDVELPPTKHGSPNFKKPAIYRQLAAGVHGDCKGREVAGVSKEVATEVVLFEPGLDAGSHYLMLEGSDRSFMDFRLVNEYSDGSTDLVPMLSYRKVPGTGRFFTTFVEGRGTVTRVSLKVPPRAAHGTVEARLCKVMD